MSFTHRSLVRASRSCQNAISRSNSTAGPSTAVSSAASTEIRASLLLSRPPLLTKTPTPFESAYYAHSASLHHALANPTAETFYFREGSLPLRRYQVATHQYETSIFGPALAGKAPDVGEIAPERPYDEFARSHWDEADSERGDQSLERFPEEEVFCLVKSRDGKWTFPGTEVKGGETFHGKLETSLTGPTGELDGRTMDTWLIAKKPIGVVKGDQTRNFFFRSHILAGEPKLSKESQYTSHAWLTREEVETRLREQGDKELWWAVRSMFGVNEQEDQREWREGEQAKVIEEAKARRAALADSAQSASTEAVA